MELPSPPHAFSPFLQFFEDDSFLFNWRDTGLKGAAYFSARNDPVPLVRASQSNDIAGVQNLISSPGVRIDEGGLEGETALHMASALGYADIVETLITAGASVNATDHEGSTSLVHCTRFCPENDSARVVTILLTAGADPLHAVSVDLERVPPLWFSIRNHNMSAVRLLAPLTPLDFPGSSSPKRYITDVAVYGAVTHADTQILEFLIESGLPLEMRNLAQATDDRTFTVITQALRLSNAKIAREAPQILFGTWALDRRTTAPFLKRLVEQYQLEVNQEGIPEFVVSSGSIELLTTSAMLGLDLKSMPVDVVQSWIGQRTSQPFKTLMRDMCDEKYNSHV
ncbi:ankyrin repeat-containing domain protein [Mycena crocata]|nr:ankyrin repeat-containing domain protein [Mycena crocata]